jgi:hypothetical protein
MYIREAIQNILEQDLDLMRENLKVAITEKAVQSLEEKKVQIAENYFGQYNNLDSEDKE